MAKPLIFRLTSSRNFSLHRNSATKKQSKVNLVQIKLQTKEINPQELNCYQTIRRGFTTFLYASGVVRKLSQFVEILSQIKSVDMSKRKNC